MKRFSKITDTGRAALRRSLTIIKAAGAAMTLGLIELFASKPGRLVLAVGLLLGSTALLIANPPFHVVKPGDAGVRVNNITGGLSVASAGPLLILPWIHDMRTFSLREQVYRPGDATADNRAYQTLEGLTIDVDVTVRYSLDSTRIADIAQKLPADIGRDLVRPSVDAVVHRVVSRHTVKEVFTSKREEIEKQIADDLRANLARDGVNVRAVFVGDVQLPKEYRAGLEGMLAEELQSEKMRYTLELRAKQVQETRLQAEAEKAQRETAAEAAGREQIIAAKARAEAMQHVLPLKEKEIEQGRLEAQARKVQRLLAAEAEADARLVEAEAEAKARRKLAEAEAFRIEVTGKANSDQMARDSELIAKNPLLIQKTLADKLSERVQVIIAPPAQGNFIAGNLIGMPGKPAAE